MKTMFLSLLTMMMTGKAFASGVVILDCKLIKLHDSSEFEESFSANEYPDLKIWRNKANGFYRVSIGMSAYTSESKDAVTVKTSRKSETYSQVVFRIVPSHRASDYTIIYDAKVDSNVARLYARELQRGKDKPRLIATMACSSLLTAN